MLRRENVQNVVGWLGGGAQEQRDEREREAHLVGGLLFVEPLQRTRLWARLVVHRDVDRLAFNLFVVQNCLWFKLFVVQIVCCSNCLLFNFFAFRITISI